MTESVAAAPVLDRTWQPSSDDVAKAVERVWERITRRDDVPGAGDTPRVTAGATAVTTAVEAGALAAAPVRDFYLSADSAPKGYAVRRPTWVAPSFLALFGLLSALAVPPLAALTSQYSRFLVTITDATPSQVAGTGASLSFRPFLALLMLMLSVFAEGSLRQRLGLLVWLWSCYVVTLLAMDILLAQASVYGVVSPLSPVGGILAGSLGLLVITGMVFTRYKLPPGVRVDTRLRPRRHLRLLLCLGGAIVTAFAFSFLRDRYFEGLKPRFVGGLDSEVVVSLLTLWVLLYLCSIRDRRAKPTHGPQLSVAFLIPAFNEAHGIGPCLRALDAAAEAHDGPCAVYVVDNGSVDDTPAVAEKELAACRHLEGTVLICPSPGKGHALNYGIRHITSDVIIRIDADTLVPPSLLESVLPWFWDPMVGGVSGLPLPKRTAMWWFYPLRLIEVFYGVAFLRVAQSATDAVMVMPGLMAAYRRTALEEVGGFGGGFNGEDADVTMRIGRLGYRIVTDSEVRVLTETPETVGHLREQRQRWARGLYHMASRNMSCIWMRQGARGLWLLPWSIANGARRAMMLPLLLGAGLVELLAPSVLSLREVSVVAGFVVGLQLIVITVVLLMNRQFRIVAFVPVYLVYRICRAYFSFEGLLSMRLHPEPRVKASQKATPVPAAVPPLTTPLSYQPPNPAPARLTS